MLQIKFTSPDRIKLTLQHKRLECKQLEEQISNMKKALDNDSHIVSPELSTDFQKLFSQTLLMNLLKKLHHFLKLKDMLPYYLMK